MTRHRAMLALSAFAAIGGIAAYVLLSSLLLFIAVAFVGIVAFLVLIGTGAPEAAWVQPDEVRRADDREAHPMPQGPAPPFQS